MYSYESLLLDMRGSGGKGTGDTWAGEVASNAWLPHVLAWCGDVYVDYDRFAFKGPGLGYETKPNQNPAKRDSYNTYVCAK